MLDKKDIQCLLFEGGATINFKNRKYQPLGSAVIQATLESATCSQKSTCNFRFKHGRCPTKEEIKLKYYTDN